MRQQTLGSYIRFLRKQNNMTQAMLADRLGVTDKAVSKWERDISFPDIALFPKLADTLGVTIDDLLSENSEEGHSSRLLQIYEMSHDIRTPLHMILGCVNMAEMHYKDKELLLRYLESIRISGEYLLKTIEKLMRVANREGDEDARKDFPSDAHELGIYLQERAKSRREALIGYDLSGRRILVTEDIMLNREIAAEILRQTGAEVVFAEDGQMCLDMINAAPAGYYDLILMDIMMPVMDGLEATRRIRQMEDPKKASIPIIAVSANVHEKDRAEALNAGMNDFAEKPIFIDRLFETMRKYI